MLDPDETVLAGRGTDADGRDEADEKTRFARRGDETRVALRHSDETRVVARQDERTTLRRRAPHEAGGDPTSAEAVAGTLPPAGNEIYGIRSAVPTSAPIRHDFTAGRADASASVPPAEQRIAARRKQRRAGLGAVIAVALTAVGSIIVIIVGVGFIASL